MYALFNLIATVIDLYIWALIISVILSWLVAYNVVNTGNKFVLTVMDFLNRITAPALRPIRNILPDMGGLDLSPIVLILGLIFLKNLLLYDLLPHLT
ncbi:MAG: hypothetical protein CMF31_01925 [Kordiimonas sp.]|nr:hypothetical protein [Kordiimonas sp.]|tara:strand:+ start:845 stop:1135 length:291 start_codon:yes stop_codon:yes gene_type:complete